MNLFYTIIRGLLVLPTRIIYPTKVIDRKKNLPSKKNRYITISNHLKWTDILLVAVYIPGYRNVLAKKEVGKNVIVRNLANWLGVIMVDRTNTDIKTIRRCVNLLKDNHKLSMFPEGTRNKVDESLQQIRGGAALFSLKAEAMLVPIMIHHKSRAFRKNYIYVGEPFGLSELYGKGLSAEIIGKASDIIATHMTAAKEYLDDYVANKRWKKKNRLVKTEQSQDVELIDSDLTASNVRQVSEQAEAVLDTQGEQSQDIDLIDSDLTAGNALQESEQAEAILDTQGENE